MLAVKSIADIIRERTSVKNGYVDKEVSLELVLSLLKDAVWAPTHGVREPWRFIFISRDRKDDFIEVILQCHEKDKHEIIRNKFVNVPAFLVVIMNVDPRQKVWEEDFAATSCMLQNLQLLAWEQEIGMVWKTPIHIHDPKFRQSLEVAPGEKVVGVLNIGYFDKEIIARKIRKRTDPSEKLVSF
ncbi:nitroreductase family protein [Lederbergia panacisoli]|uniref:nitroreductase family protein n=1 Tax=Lederbergia panacisoli TaxID=1255251 RepID=UPI00214AE817|nr:nitroreductase [Lederbergia panacisoli]MCR2822535.1 nitroreductase [Lederbergia panacisoli]